MWKTDVARGALRVMEIEIIFLAERKRHLARRYILRVFHYKFAFRMHEL
jgi:hypothetical protein